MESKLCKKCEKPLPEGYDYDKCENCRNKVANVVKKGLKIGGGAAVALVAVAIPALGKVKDMVKK